VHSFSTRKILEKKEIFTFWNYSVKRL